MRCGARGPETSRRRRGWSACRASSRRLCRAALSRPQRRPAGEQRRPAGRSGRRGLLGLVFAHLVRRRAPAAAAARGAARAPPRRAARADRPAPCGRARVRGRASACPWSSRAARGRGGRSDGAGARRGPCASSSSIVETIELGSHPDALAERVLGDRALGLEHVERAPHPRVEPERLDSLGEAASGRPSRSG